MPKYDSPPFDPLGAHHTQSPPQHHVFNPFFTGRPVDRTTPPPTDRHELIRRIKSGDIQRHQEEQPPRHSPTTEDNTQAGLDIIRPRSALHRGDFRDELQPQPISTSPVVPWHQPPSQLLGRPRAASHASLSASFSYQPPTSPLVHQANAADIPDFPGHPHTPSRPLPRHSSLRGFPYQAHQPRRSIGSIGSLSHSPFLSTRRLSITDASPLQHAPMVGSYEESILRGRMSTTPSKPLDFVAQIGVLGKGDCKPSLKCPPHIAIPFPAVFYSYASGNHHTEPEPSPYVGMVDLENAVKKPDKTDDIPLRKHHEHVNDPYVEQCLPTDSPKPHKRRKHNHSTPKTSAPPGSYRIPAIGQLQIVIKNPNKTAVKLFLVPYDLSSMPAGTKTFIRQRSYSAGPIIDMPVSVLQKSSLQDSQSTRPILRYLVHLHICRTGQGRYYLYRDIRVVFANRVPDGKEKLRTETQMQGPPYSIYKPSLLSSDNKNATSEIDMVAEAKNRRRSAVFPSQHYQYRQDKILSSVDSSTHAFSYTAGSSTSFHAFRPLPTLESRPVSRCDGMDSRPDTSNGSKPSSSIHDTEDRHVETQLDGFTFERERIDLGRSLVPRVEGLLSRRLRGLEVRGVVDEEEGRNRD